MRSGARAEEAADCKNNDIRLRMERDGTYNTDRFRSGAKEYKNLLNSDFMDFENFFLDSKTKKPVSEVKQGGPGEEYTADSALNTKLGKRSSEGVGANRETKRGQDGQTTTHP